MTRWAPEKEGYNKQSSHLAMDDIRDSIHPFDQESR